MKLQNVRRRAFHSTVAATAVFTSLAMPANAHEGDGGKVTYATDHAPIGVMADHRHKKGEFMVSLRAMYMDMSGNRDGTDSVSPEDIATSGPNPFAGMPPTLRVVPLDMPMKMVMPGVMYGLNDRVTLMAMGMYLENEMEHVTYQGGMEATSTPSSIWACPSHFPPGRLMRQHRC